MLPDTLASRVLTEDEILERLALDYVVPDIPSKLFGVEATREVQGALERSGIIDLDTLVLRGDMKLDQMYEQATYYPDLREGHEELFRAAVRAADHFARRGRARYYIERCFDAKGRTTNKGMFQILEQVYESGLQLTLQDVGTYTMRNDMLEDYFARLWGEIVLRFHAAANEDLSLAVRWRRLTAENYLHLSTSPNELDGTLPNDPLVVRMEAQTPFDVTFLEAHRRRGVIDIAAIPDAPEPTETDWEAIDMGMYTPLLQEGTVVETETFRLTHFPLPQASQACVAASAFAMLKLEFHTPIHGRAGKQETHVIDMKLHRATRELLIEPCYLPLASIWPELHAKILPLVVGNLLVESQKQKPVLQTWDHVAYREEQLRIRESLKEVDAPLAQEQQPEFDPLPLPSVKTAAVVRALTRLLGPPLQTASSHQKFRTRSGGTFSLPVHSRRDVHRRLLRDGLALCGISHREFIDEL